MGRRNQKQEQKRRCGHVRLLKREESRTQSARGTALRRAREANPPKPVKDLTPFSPVSGEPVATRSSYGARAAIFSGEFQGGEQ